MKTSKLIIQSILIVMPVFFLLACGKQSSDTANVNVQFANQTASVMANEMKSVGFLGLANGLSLQAQSLAGETPLIYQMKFIAMYLVEDIDAVTQDNVGDMTRIWTNSHCDADLRHCGIGPSAGQYQINDYFDFSQGTAAVNAQIAAYTRDTLESKANPGSFNYIRIDFTGIRLTDADMEIPSLKFGAQVAHEVKAQKTAINIRLPETLVLKKGESFTVNMAYDLQNRYYPSAAAFPKPTEVSDDQYWTCDGVGSEVPCIVEAEFAPTVSKR